MKAPSVPCDGSWTNPNSVSVSATPVQPCAVGSGVEGVGCVGGAANEPANATGELPENITLKVGCPNIDPLIHVPVTASLDGNAIFSGLYTWLMVNIPRNVPPLTVEDGTDVTDSLKVPHATTCGALPTELAAAWLIIQFPLTVI